MGRPPGASLWLHEMDQRHLATTQTQQWRHLLGWLGHEHHEPKGVRESLAAIGNAVPRAIPYSQEESRRADPYSSAANPARKDV